MQASEYVVFALLQRWSKPYTQCVYRWSRTRRVLHSTTNTEGVKTMNFISLFQLKCSLLVSGWNWVMSEIAALLQNVTHSALPIVIDIQKKGEGVERERGG